MNNEVVVPQGKEYTAAERIKLIRDCLRAAERIHLIVCDLLADAYLHADWIDLGLASFSDYTMGLGLSQSQASKMLKIGRCFPAEMRETLPEVDADELSVERLYAAARLVEQGRFSAEDALQEAKVHPAEHLVAMLNGSEPSDARPVECPYCGSSHLCYQAPVIGKGEVDVPLG
jgi:hypothetical protein